MKIFSEIYVSALGLLSFFLLCQISGAENWELTCPDSCECKWYNNKRVADCSNAGYSTILSSLSSAVQVLDLTRNNIRGLSENAFQSVKLINLNKLTLAKNKITEIHPGAFNNLILLMDLDLSNNFIQKLHPRTFSGLVKMRNLILDGNILSRLEPYQFPQLPNLQHLSINNCQLNFTNSYAFSNLPVLTRVSLRGNRLTVLQPELFMSRPMLKSVELMDNLWVCDCNLKRLISWIHKEKKGQNGVSCHSPERMAGKLWLKLREHELACSPEMVVPQTEVPISLGGNATLACGARGEPLPKMKWILDGRLLTNLTEFTIPFSESEPNVKFLIHEDLVDGLFWTNLTVIQIGEDFMLHGYDQSSPFKCVVENPAKMVEKNVTLVIGMVVESPIITGSYLHIYVVIAIVTVAVLLLILIILICLCCLRKRKQKERPQVVKANGNDKAFMERNNILIVNPVEKPPRKNEFYEKLPQADDIELTDLTKGAHRNFDEMNYPEERVGRVRSPLTPLEEEEFEQVSQKLLNDSLNTTATVDYVLQYPDLLDNIRFPRAVSPTQLSYHSLVNPMYSPNPEWRYSYVYPSEYGPNRASQTLQPQLYQRPGYVTLPRRPRTSSVTSAPPSTSRQLSPTFKLEPIYDTLGPRTTADGTSRTDLTRAMSRSVMDPYNPYTPISPSSPPFLPLHYVPITREAECLPTITSQSSTLPRSTPNLLEDKGLSIPHLSEEKSRSRHTPTPPNARHTPTPPNRHTPTPPKTYSVNNNLSPKDKPSAKDKLTSNAPTLRINRNLKTSNLPDAYKINDKNDNRNNNKATSPDRPKVLPNGSILNNDNRDDGGVSVKKVPPKPLPKPSVKRLSVSSTASDATSKLSQGGSVGGLNFQDEGPDGTEV